MHVKSGKKPVWILLATILLASILTISIPPSAKASTTMLSVDPPEIIDTGKTPGQSFSVNINITDVVNMWGYLFFLGYDTNVLTATSFSSDPIFWMQEPSTINDTAGYVVMSFHMAFGAPTGFTGSLPGTAPFPLATIQFTVDDYGWSPLDLYGSVLADPVGGAIAHEEADSYFANEIHDIAVTDVTTFNATTSPVTEVTKPNPVFVNVTVTNNGDVSETFDVTAYYDSNTVGTHTGITLATGASTVKTFTWDTTYVSVGTYTISANATELPSESPNQRADNTFIDGTVTVNSPVTASFTYTPPTPYENQTITFNASDSISLIGTIIRYAWDFNDSTTEIYEGGNLSSITTHKYTAAGPYYVILNVTDNNGFWDAVQKPVTVYRHDVAVDSVTPSKTNVTRRGTVKIDVEVVNEGNFTETFDVTTYYNETATSWKEIEQKTVTNLAPDNSATESFSWNTENVSVGTYKIKAVADTILGETDTADNTKVSGIEVTILPIHDVDIINVTASPTTVGLGEIVNINVTAANKGDYDETFDVTTFFGDEPIEPDFIKIVSLAAGANKTLLLIWDTTNATTGVYTITAKAKPVTNETDTTHNSLNFDGTVTVLGHDIAIVAFEVSPSSIFGAHRVTPGESITIKVDVYNKGTTIETFDVTVYYDNHDIGTQTVTELENATSTRLTFSWNTTDVVEGTYTLSATATTVPGERLIDTDDNTKEYDLKVIIGYHNVAITDVTASPTEVQVGESILISITVKNQGIFPESDVNVTVKYGDTEIETQTVTYLKDGASTTLSFTWGTTDVTPGTYTLSATATTVPGERLIDTDDNTLIGLTVAVKVTSNITISADPTTIAVGETTTISGTITPTRVEATVTIWWRLSGEETWNTATVQTNENSQYSYDWKPPAAGTYEVKASWAGDAGTFEAESDPQTIMVEEASGLGFVLYAVAGLAIVIVAVSIFVYVLKVRKPQSA